jgi:PAS domain S-box-containing protein
MESNQTAVEQRIAQLEIRFLTTLPVRLLSIASSLSRAQSNAPGAVRDLENQLHALAGTAGTYRVPAVAALAAEAEAICAAAEDGLDEREIVLLRRLVAAMETLASTDPPDAGKTLMPISISSFAEETLVGLLHAAFDGIVVHVNGRVTAVDEKCAAMFGVAADAVIGHSILDFIHPEHHAAVLRRMRNESREPFHLTGIRSDGVEVPLEICAITSRGGAVRIVAIKDLTAAKKAQDQLVESELRYRELLESSHDLMCQHDLDGRILSVNSIAEASLEMSAGELCAMNIRDLVVPRRRDEFDGYLEAICTHGVAEGLMMVRTPTGRERIWHYQNTLLRTGPEGPVVRCRSRDVTEREQALQALRRSERRFRSIIENASDVIVILDRDGTITYHSPAMTRVLGYGPGEMVSHDYLELVHPDERQTASELFQRQFDSPKEVHSADFRARHRDGSWRNLAVTTSCIFIDDHAQSLIINARDMTDRHLLEAQLEQANRLNGLGRLTATVAHEFNNVLMGMQPFADLMQRPGVSPEVCAKGARHIANSIARGKRVAMDMLRFTRPAEPTMSRVLLHEWWQRFAPEAFATLGDDIQVHWQIPRSLNVDADTAQLSQVLTNLVNNARDAMPKGGALSVRARVPRNSETFSFGIVPDAHQFVQISVEDTGTGMPPNVRRHAFDPLFTTKQNRGTGLGLAVAHQVMARHGGYIFVESEEGAGTTFHLFLPLASDGPCEQAAETTEPRVTLRRVLLVEDEQAIREGVADALMERDMSVEAVGLGRDAVLAMKRFAPELAIVDIGLPDIDGTEVGRSLRALDPNLMIIFASGHGDVSRSIAEFTPAIFLQKPFETLELLGAIATLERENV